MKWFAKRFSVSPIPRDVPQVSGTHDPRSTTHAFSLSAAALIALAAGCAELQWQKEGATAEATENDLAECRGEARINAGPDARFVRPDAGRIVGLSAGGRPVPGSAGALHTDRFIAEHDLTRTCMQRKGYELAPAVKR